MVLVIKDMRKWNCRNNAKKSNTEFYNRLQAKNEEKNTFGDENRPDLMESIQSMSARNMRNFFNS